MGLNGFDLREFVKKHPILQPAFEDIFFIDTIPQRIPKNHFFFANTAKQSDSVGKHWILLYRSRKNIYECFDSLGTTSSWITKNLKFPAKIQFNLKNVQSFDSSTCGIFVCSFVLLRILNADCNFESVLNEYFSSDIIQNEKFAKDVYQDF